jgi:DNA recombination protein RmuC
MIRTRYNSPLEEMILSFETTLVLILLVVLILVSAAALTAFLVSARRPPPYPEGLTLLQHQLDSLRSELASYIEGQSSRLEQAHATMGQRLDQASRSVTEVGQQLGRLEKATQHVIEVGQSVVHIENLFRTPKLRGVVGETLLAEILRQSIPETLYALQHPLRNGERVDAVVRVGESLLPVDAKFPLENLRRAQEAATQAEREPFFRAFARDFKKHVDDIADKYIVPDHGTLPLAFLYVPAENVYQQAVLGDWQLAEYALSRRVVPTGPIGFYAFLQSVLLGAKTLAVSGHAREILAGLEQAAVEVERVEQDLTKLNRHLELAGSNAELVGKRLSRLTHTLDETRSVFPRPPEESGG